MNEQQSKPHVKATKNVELSLSPIWFLPILAVLISAWLLIKLNLESKVPITIEMATAQGIVAGKTQLKFRGINAGKVTSIEVAESLTHVLVHAEVEPSLADYLTNDAKFWVVRAQISLAGVSGLDTVLSGDYIAFEPGKDGESRRYFRAMHSAPPIGEDDPGLRITLTSESLGSISEGSRLYYRQIPIGEVRFYELSEDTRTVSISALIESKYSHLVNQSTVFWNSGGVRVKGSLSGFEVQTESVSAILAGGISLFTPDTEAPNIDTTHFFSLHEDYDDAGVGVPIKVAFPSGYDLQSGITKVKFHGIDVGHLDSINVIPDDESGILANVIIDPGAEPLLVTDTQFWLVKPNLSIRNLSNLETLISGNYITMKIGDSLESAREFQALDGPPPPDFKDPGLHVILKSKTMGSIALDTPVLFKGVEVGRVANIFVNDLNEGLGFHLHIRPEYGHLINSSSRFWDASGLDVSAGLGGIKIRSSSIMNIIRGGIAFETVDDNASEIDDGYEFRLLDNPLASENPLSIRIEIPTADSFQQDVTTIKYKGLSVGILKRLEYQHEQDRMFAHFDVNQNYQSLITENTTFWLVSPQLGAGKVSGLDSLFGGPYVTFNSAAGAAKTEFILSNSAAPKNASDKGLTLELVAPRSMSQQPGSPVYHRQIEVGSVQYVRMAQQGVLIGIHISAEHQYLVKASSRFWNVSGFQVSASASGIDVNTESIQTILAGGIAFGLQGEVNTARVVEHGEQFKLYATQKAAEAGGIQINLLDQEASGIAVGAAIRYQGLIVGEVTQQHLNDQDQIELMASIADKYKALLTQGSIFWIAKARIGLTRQENLGQLLSGPEIRVSKGPGAYRDTFTLSTQQPVRKVMPTGLNLVLETSRLGSIKIGTELYYRQMVVGNVVGYQLSKTADRVQIFANIKPQYQRLIRSNTKFWNASGIQMSAGLLSGVELKTESVEAILAGGIALATPDDPGAPVADGESFKLYTELDPDWLDWAPLIELE